MQIVNRTRLNSYLVNSSFGMYTEKDGDVNVYFDDVVGLPCYDWTKRNELFYCMYGRILKLERSERKEMLNQDDFNRALDEFLCSSTKI